MLWSSSVSSQEIELEWLRQIRMCSSEFRTKSKSLLTYELETTNCGYGLHSSSLRLSYLFKPDRCSSRNSCCESYHNSHQHSSEATWSGLHRRTQWLSCFARRSWVCLLGLWLGGSCHNFQRHWSIRRSIWGISHWGSTLQQWERMARLGCGRRRKCRSSTLLYVSFPLPCISSYCAQTSHIGLGPQAGSVLFLICTQFYANLFIPRW